MSAAGFFSWTRRNWLTTHAVTLTAFALRAPTLSRRRASRRSHRPLDATAAARAARLDPAPWQALAQQAVEVARAAGAQYADARLTRQVMQEYNVMYGFQQDEELVGIGVRTLVDGYWGFSASAALVSDEVARLARQAVGQARENAKGAPWTVDLGRVPVAAGTWATPVRIDPFEISIEEKLDSIAYWVQCAQKSGVDLYVGGGTSWIRCIRQERVVATSDGALFTQTLFESGGFIDCFRDADQSNTREGQIGRAYGIGNGVHQVVHGIEDAGIGWELFLDAKIPEQFLSGQLKGEMEATAAIPSRPFSLGRYTLVCDGATMGRLLENSLGVATQLDRALGYEANAGGTSFIDDPLAMVGHLPIASPLVTVTANRSAPQQLASVKWDEEGVEPEPFTLVKDGVLVDFQTTREQAAWLAPYYQAQGRPVRSHGCAAAESAHVQPIQHMPNLSLEPSSTAIGLEELVADVKAGILVEGCDVFSKDFQARTGQLGAFFNKGARMREIKNGRVGSILTGGAVLYDSMELWKGVRAVGGASTQMVVGSSGIGSIWDGVRYMLNAKNRKGQPPQLVSHSVRAAAATLSNQPLIDPLRKA